MLQMKISNWPCSSFCILNFWEGLYFIHIWQSFHIISFEISFCSFKLVKGIAAALLPLPFLQHNGSVLRKMFLVLHFNTIDEWAIGEEFLIIEIFVESVSKIVMRTCYEGCIESQHLWLLLSPSVSLYCFKDELKWLVKRLLILNSFQALFVDLKERNILSCDLQIHLIEFLRLPCF